HQPGRAPPRDRIRERHRAPDPGKPSAGEGRLGAWAQPRTAAQAPARGGRGGDGGAAALVRRGAPAPPRLADVPARTGDGGAGGDEGTAGDGEARPDNGRRGDRSMSRVAVIGAGAVGCYYGARLAEAGHEVHFVLRREYDAVAAHGLHVHSPDGDLHLEHPSIARNADDIGPVDWILCALKATALEEARELLAPCVGDETRILALMNGLGVEERFADSVGPA